MLRFLFKTAMLAVLVLGMAFKAYAQDVSLTYTQPFAAGTEVGLNPGDELRYGHWQIDWYKTDGNSEQLLSSNSPTIQLNDNNMNAGERIFARLTSGSIIIKSTETPAYQTATAFQYNILSAHDIRFPIIENGETITITSTSLQINGIAVNRNVTYRWFGTNSASDLGEPYNNVNSPINLANTTNSYTVDSSNGARYNAVEIAFVDNNTTITKVLYFDTSVARLPLSETNYKVFEDIMLNQLALKSSLELWLDVNDSSTLFTDTACNTPASDGDEVACWMDKSGLDRHVYDMNYTGPGGLAIPTAKKDFGRPVYNASSVMFKGFASLDFESTEFDALVHKLDASDEWFDNFTLIQILGYTEVAKDWYSTIATRTVAAGGNTWPNEPNMSLQIHQRGGKYATSWRAWGPNVGGTGADYSGDFGDWQQNVSQVLELRNSCMPIPNANPMPANRQLCTQNLYREGELVDTNSLDISADSLLFSEYGINKNRGGSLTPTASHSEVLLFRKALSGCEAFVVGRYIGLKLTRAIGRIPQSQTGTGYTNDMEVLGYNASASTDCNQDFFVDVGASSFLQLGFNPYSPADSDYDLINKKEFLLFGHDDGDFSDIQTSPSATLPPTPSGSTINSFVERKWQVEFESPNNAPAPIKQITLVFNTVGLALQLSNVSYANPYLLIQRGTQSLEVDGRYSGNNTITFDQVDLEHDDIVQLTFDLNQPNRAPTSADVSIYGQSPFSFSASDFSYSDLDGDDFYRVRITSVPSEGQLTFNGTIVNNGDEVLISDIADLVYSFDRSDSMPQNMTYEVSDGMGWSSPHTFTFNSYEFFQQISPTLNQYRIGDELEVTTRVEINRVEQPMAQVDYIWWAVSSVNDTNSEYSSRFPQLSTGTRLTVNNDQFGQYLMVQSSYTNGSGETITELRNLGQVGALQPDTRPNRPWPRQMQTNSQYVYDGLTISPSLVIGSGEINPPLVQYCYYNNDTDAVLQACGNNGTFAVDSTSSSLTIRVEAIMSDPSNTNIENQTLSTILTPLDSNIDLSQPVIQPSLRLMPGVTVNVEPPTRFAGNTVVYQWYRYQNGQYTAIGQDQNSYTVTFDDIGFQLVLQVAVDDNGTNVFLTSGATATVNLISEIALLHERPLSEQDEIGIVDPNALENDITSLINLNANLTASYQWEESSNGVNWMAMGMAESTYSRRQSLNAGQYYRLKVNMSEPGFGGMGVGTTYSAYSNVSSQVQSTLGNIDYDINIDALETPTKNIEYRVYSELTTASGQASYSTRRHNWYRVNQGGSLTPLSTQAVYRPVSDDIGLALRVTIGYYDTNNALLSEITLDTPAVMPAPSSTALIDTINALTGTLTPTELSVGMPVSLSTADVTTLANSGLDVAYQWQQGTLGGSWNDITDAELSSYSTQNSDVGSALTLCLTLTEGSESQSVCTDPTNIVTDNASGYTLRTLYLRLDSSTDTLSLINDSQIWLNNLLTTENLSASYQWHRVPESGSVDSGGTAIGSATSSYADYVLTADDDNYRHALRVTLSNGDEVNSDLSSEWGGAGSTSTNPDGTFQDLYLDVVRIEGGATPYVVGDTLTARMSGSTASNSQLPDSVNYQWQQFNAMATPQWQPISGATGSSYTVAMLMAPTQVRVVATPMVNNAALTARIASAVEVQVSAPERLSIEMVPSLSPIPQNEILGVTVLESPVNATLSYQWYRLQVRVGEVDSWPASSAITGATGANYQVQAADQDGYIGVRVSESGSNLQAGVLSAGRVATATTGDTLSLVASISTAPVYEDSVAQYQGQLLRNNVIDTNATLDASWYVVDDPAQVNAPETWGTALTPPLSNTSLQGQSGRYLLLVLSYTENGQTQVRSTDVSDAIEAALPTSDRDTLASWYQGVLITPDSPASLVSSPSLEPTDGSQTVSHEDNGYTVSYQYRSEQAPAQSYNSIADLLSDHPTTTRLTVSATQNEIGGTLSQQLGPITVPFSNGTSMTPGVLDITAPLLSYSQPRLLDTDSITLINLVTVESEIAERLGANQGLSVSYQWQSQDVNAAGIWSDVVGAQGSTFSALSSLNVDNSYRLLITLSDSNNNAVSMTSDTSTVVESATGVVDYDIVYESLSPPQVSVNYAITSELRSHQATTSYASRRHAWSRVASDGSLTPLSTQAVYPPVTDDIGLALRVTIGYYDTNNALLSEITLDTAAVMPAPSSTGLIDTINALTGTLTPTELSVGMQVSLSTADVTTLANSGLDVAYQWQQGTLGGSWNDITDAELSSYSAQNSDVGSALQLCITLTDTTLMQSGIICADPTNIVTDNASGYTLRTLYLRLDSSTDTLSLINDSQVWLNNLLTTENLSASYQWYRVPESGSVDSGGTAIGSATSSYADYVLTSDDNNYRHALRVTLSNGDEVNSDLSSEWVGAGSTGTNSDGTFQDLYLDIVRIEGGATPYVVGDTLTARMSGSTASNSQIPDSVNYQWQQFNAMATPQWQPIPGAIGSTHTVAMLMAPTQVRVVATPIVNSAALTARIANAVEVQVSAPERLSIEMVPSLSPIPQNEILGVTVLESPANATLSYQWYRLQGRVGEVDSWPASSAITGETGANYQVQAADQDRYIGVRVSESGSNLQTGVLSAARVASVTTGDSLSLVASISTAPVYEDSVAQYQGQLLRNNAIDTNATLDASWYVVDDPAQVTAPETWGTALTLPLSNTSLQGQSGRYLLLVLSYTENGQTQVRSTDVSDAIALGNTPEEIRQWFSQINIEPAQPVTSDSVVSVIANNNLENTAPEDGIYQISYLFVSDLAPNQTFTSLIDMEAAYPDTNNVRVIAHQVSIQNLNIVRTLNSKTHTFALAHDLDGDGILNEWDDDIDGDGVVNTLDAFPENIEISPDIDGDGEPDSLDDKAITQIDISGDDIYNIDSNQMVKFVPLTLSNGGTLTSSNALVGRVSIVDNTLLYQASDSMPQQMYIEYTWVNDSGETMADYLLLISNDVDPNAPRFDDVKPRDISATSLFTPIASLPPTAKDVLGNPLPVSLRDNIPRLRSGNHVVYWEATDPNTQATQTVGQLFRVFPQVNFEQRTAIYENNKAQITVHLMGASPVYPVSIPIEIASELSSSDFNDHSLQAMQTITIESGVKGVINFDVYGSDGNEGSESLTVVFSEDVNAGSHDSLTFTLLESEPMPTIDAKIIDANEKVRSLVYPELVDDLYLTVDIFKPNESVSIEIDWYVIFEGDKQWLGTTLDTAKLPVDISGESGRYYFDYQGRVLDTDLPELKGRVSLRVMDTMVLTSNQDSDNDGIADMYEGFLDTDNDLIPDFLDAVNSCELQAIDNEKALGGGYVLQSSPGSCIQLGNLSEKVGTYSPYISNEQRNIISAEDAALLPPDIEFEDTYTDSHVTNFTITEVFNDSISIVLPMLRPLVPGSFYRKYTERAGWFTFDESEEGSNLRYAQGELGFCPPPGSDEYQETIILGGYCLEITIKDGGIHDGDGERNGHIDDPGYMVFAPTPLDIPGFTVDAQAVFDPQTDKKVLQFNLCDYITAVDCQSLSVNNGNINSGGVVTSVKQDITITMPVWIDLIEVQLTINNGESVTIVPVQLDLSLPISTLTEPERKNFETVAGGGALALFNLLLIWLLIRTRRSENVVKW